MATTPRPTVEPLLIYAGDTLQFDKTIPNFSAVDGWTLKYIIGGPGLTTINDVAGANITSTGVTFNINVPAATTAKWAPGKYQWVAQVTNGTQTYTIAQGRIEIKQNPATEGALIETRTQAQINLDAIDAVLAGAASNDVKQYRVGHGITGREITKMDKAELLQWRGYWAEIVRNERIRAGEVMPSRTVGIYFGTPSI